MAFVPSLAMMGVHVGAQHSALDRLEAVDPTVLLPLNPFNTKVLTHEIYLFEKEPGLASNVVAWLRMSGPTVHLH